MQKLCTVHAYIHDFFSSRAVFSSSISYLAAVLQLASYLCLLQALPAAKTAVKQKVNIKWLLHDEKTTLLQQQKYSTYEPTVANPAQARLKPFKQKGVASDRHQAVKPKGDKLCLEILGQAHEQEICMKMESEELNLFLVEMCQYSIRQQQVHTCQWSKNQRRYHICS